MADLTNKATDDLAAGQLERAADLASWMKATDGDALINGGLRREFGDYIERMVAELQRRRAEQAAGRDHVERVVREEAMAHSILKARVSIGAFTQWVDDLARRVADRLSVPVLSAKSHLVQVARLADALPVDQEADDAVSRAMAESRSGKSRKLMPVLSAEEREHVSYFASRMRDELPMLCSILDRLIAGAKP